MHPKRVFFVLMAVVLSSAFLASNEASAAPILYTISDSPTNAAAGPGQLSPGTLAGTFYYDPATQTFSSASLTISGVQSCNLNGSYGLYSSGGSSSTNLLIQGMTAFNECAQSNTNAYLDVSFSTALALGGDQIDQIRSFQGNPADFTLPPTVAYADAEVPEPSSAALLLPAVLLLGWGVAVRRRKFQRT